MHQVCREGDEIQLPDLNAEFRVLEVPAHTRSHIAFYGENVLFSGDTLFSLGCGRFFEGTATDMQASLDKLSALPADTKIYCAHEYTQANCAFALKVEPDNPCTTGPAPGKSMICGLKAKSPYQPAWLTNWQPIHFYAPVKTA